MKKLYLAAAAAAVTIAVSGGTASAADLGPYPPPGASIKDDYIPAPVAFSWRGFYFGVNAGYGWGGSDRLHFNSATDGRFGGQFDNAGGFGGGQFGYNAQFGNWVLGAEADIQGAGIGDTRVGTTAAGFAAAVQNDINYFGTIRGRIGYAAGPMLFYGTGGFAWANMIFRPSAPPPPATPSLFPTAAPRPATSSAPASSYAFARDGLRSSRYQFMDLEIAKLTGVDSGGNAIASSINPDLHTVRAGIKHPLLKNSLGRGRRGACQGHAPFSYLPVGIVLQRQ